MGEENGNWSDSLSEENRASDHVQKYSDLDSFVKDSIHAQGMIGRKGAIEPSADGSTVKDWSEYYTKTGRPETVEGYDLSTIQRNPDVPVNADAESALVQKMFDMGASNRVVKGVMEEMVGLSETGYNGGLSQIVENDKQAEQAQKHQWGAAYHGKMVQADTALKQILGDDAAEFGELRLNDGSRLGQHPKFLEALSEMGKGLIEDTAVGGKRPAMSMTPEEGLATLNALQADPKHQAALMDKNDPMHAQAQAAKTKAYKDAYPG